MTVPELVPPCRDRPGLLSLRRCLVVGLGILLLTPAWYQIGSLDRANAAGIGTQRAVDGRAGAQVDDLVQRAEALGGGRIYAGMPSNWGARFMVGRIPVFKYLENIDANEVGYTLRTASLMTNAESKLRADPQEYALFGIRYLLVPANTPAPPGASFVERRGDYALWELPGDTYVQVVETVGVVRENRGDIGENAASFMRSTLLAHGDYQAVDFAGAGASAASSGQGSAPAMAGTLVSEKVDLTRGYVRATIRASRPAVVLLHASFDPGWKVTVDGTAQPAEDGQPGPSRRRRRTRYPRRHLPVCGFPVLRPAYRYCAGRPVGGGSQRLADRPVGSLGRKLEIVQPDDPYQSAVSDRISSLSGVRRSAATTTPASYSPGARCPQAG